MGPDPSSELKRGSAVPELHGWCGEKSILEQNVVLLGKTKRRMNAERATVVKHLHSCPLELLEYTTHLGCSPLRESSAWQGRIEK